MNANIVEVEEFVRKRHAHLIYAGLPQTYHLFGVRDIMVAHGFDGFVWQASALLHDTVEDTDTSIEEVEKRFGAQVARLVWCVTGIGSNRKERNADQKRKMSAYPVSCNLKVADRIFNHKSSIKHPIHKFPDLPFVKMYHSERAEFEAVVRDHVHHRLWDSLQHTYDELTTIISNPLTKESL